MLKPSDSCIKLIQQFEGLRLTAYKDPVGIWTVGYGTTGPGIFAGLVITEPQAISLLNDHLQPVAARLSALLPNLEQNQFDALCCFIYNVGWGAFERSTMATKLQRGDPTAVAEFKRWNKAGGAVLPGLTKRREAEAALFNRSV